MIEHFFKQIIDNLGATGLLVVGLYFLLFRPLTRMARSLSVINHELGRIVVLIEAMKWRK